MYHHEVKKPVLYSKLLTIALLIIGLSACSGGGGGSTAPAAAAGAANLGAVIGGSVGAFDWSTGTKGALLAQSITDAQGNYNLVIPAAHTGEVMLELSDPTGTAVFIDETTGVQSPFPVGVIYRSIMLHPGQAPVAVTALTELVTMAAIKKVAAGLSQTQAVTEASREVGIAFLNGADPLYTMPWDLRNPTPGASVQSQQYAVVLAGIQRLASLSGVSSLAIIQRYETLMYSATVVGSALATGELAALNQQILDFQNNPPAGLNAAGAVITLPSGSTSPVLVAHAQQVAAVENRPLTITLSGDDPIGNPLTYSITTQPLHGTLSGVMPNLTYTPTMAYFGSDSSTFQVVNGIAGTAPATAIVTLNIQEVIGATPVASDGSANTAEDTPVAGLAVAIDPDGEPLIYAVATPPLAAQGTVSITNASTGEFLFTPAANFNGTAQFSFTASDPHPNISVPGNVTITVLPVNDTPIANPQTIASQEDTPTTITLVGSDYDNDPLAYMVVSAPAHGAISGLGQALLYTPNANYNGQDNFTFKVNDGQVDSAVATVLLNIAAVNDAPVVQNQSLSVAPGGVASFSMSGTDVEANQITYSITTPPANGTLSGPLTGVIGASTPLSYSANPGYFGADSISFELRDNGLPVGVATGQINITVLDFATSTADSDGDGLSDTDEVNIYGTSPVNVDTDGDSLSDFEEIVTLRFDPINNNYHYNPRIADIPSLKVDVISIPTVSLNYADSQGNTSTITTNRSIANATTVSSSDSASRESQWTTATTASSTLSSTTSATVSATVTASFSLSPFKLAEAEVSGTVSGTISRTASGTASRTSGNAGGVTVSKSTGQQNEDTNTFERGQAHELSNEIVTSSGNLSVVAQIKNVGNMPFTLRSLKLSATLLDIQHPDFLVPVGNLDIDTGGVASISFPSFSLAPGQASGPLTFGHFALDLGMAKSILNDAEAISIEPALIEIVDANGIPFAYSSIELSSKTATLVINYADKAPRESYLVSTISDPVSSSISLKNALGGALRVPYATDPVSGLLTDVRGVIASNAPGSLSDNHWQAVHYSVARGMTVYNNKGTGPNLTPPVSYARLDANALTNIQLRAGDYLALFYLEDLDGDHLTTLGEALIGTNPLNPDTDGDGLLDGDELAGWPVTVVSQNALRYSAFGDTVSIIDKAVWPNVNSAGEAFASPTSLFAGVAIDLDEARLWNTTRLPGEVFANRNIQIPAPLTQAGLIAYWPMNSHTVVLPAVGNQYWLKTDAIEVDASGHGNNLYWKNSFSLTTQASLSADWVAAGSILPAPVYDGLGAGYSRLRDAHLHRMAMPASLMSSQQGSMTLEMRFRLGGTVGGLAQPTGVGGANGVIFHTAAYDRYPDSLGFRNVIPTIYADANGLLHGQFWQGTPSNAMMSTVPVNDGMWHHVALVYDDVSQSQLLYLDGAVQGVPLPGQVNARNGSVYIAYSDPLQADADMDGLNDSAEKIAGTNPAMRDTDADRVLDAADSHPLNKDLRSPVVSQSFQLNNNARIDYSYQSFPQSADVTDYRMGIMLERSSVGSPLVPFSRLPADGADLIPYVMNAYPCDPATAICVADYYDLTSNLQGTLFRGNVGVGLGETRHYTVLERVNGVWFRGVTSKISGGVADSITITLNSIYNGICKDKFSIGGILDSICEVDPMSRTALMLI